MALLQLHHQALAQKYQSLAGVGLLGGEMASDLKVFRAAQIVVSSVEHWDQLSRNYGQALYDVGLLVVDDF